MRRTTFLSAAAGAVAFPAVVRAATRTVSVRTNWTMKGEFAPLVVAREKGLYRDAGLDVPINPGTSGTTAATSVGLGHDDFGYIPSIQVIEAIDKQLPLRAIATCGSYTGMCWASRHDVPLSGPKALEGRRVSISPSSTFFQVWDAFARKFNIDKNKVEVIGADPSARVGLFLAGRVDIMADIFVANDFQILAAKIPGNLNMMRLSQLEFDPLGYLLVTSTATAQRDPGVVRAFAQASVKGLALVHDQPAEAARLIAHAYDNLAPPIYAAQVHAFAGLVNDKPVVGRNEPKDWARSLEILRSAGVTGGSQDASAYYTNAYL